MDQPTIELFRQTKDTNHHNTGQNDKNSNKGKQPIKHMSQLQHPTLNPTQYRTPGKQRSIVEYAYRTKQAGGATAEQRGYEDKKRQWQAIQAEGEQ